MKTTSPFLLFLFLLLNLSVYSQEPVLLKDIHPTSSGASGPYVEFNGEIYFTGFDGVTGLEPWVTDGTEAGTRLLKDIRPGTNSSDPHSLIAVGPKLYFFANDGSAGNEIWSSDGTEFGTNGLSNIFSGSSGQSNTTVITEYDGKAYFPAQGSTGMELYAADASGFITSFDIKPGTASSNPDHLIVSNNKLYFAADGPPSGSARELWSTAGTIASLVKDLNPAPFIGSLQFGEFANSFDFNGLLFFTATDGTNGTELFVSDGTTAGTNLFADLVPGSAASNPRNFIEFNNHMFFSAGAPGGTYRLWISDGTSGGTQLFGNINIGSNPDFTIVGSKMYFFNQVTPTVKELWVTDGTVGGTQLFLNTAPLFNNMSLFTAFNNELYFSATPVGGSGTFLYKVGEDPATLEEVKPANSNSTNVSPRNLTVFGERLYYDAVYDNLIGREVYYIEALNPIVWTGNTSSNWNDITNWEPQQMPLEDDNVKIPDGRPHYPVITTGTASCRKLEIQTGGTLSMTGGTLNVYGRILANNQSQFHLFNLSSSGVTGGTLVLMHGSDFPPDMFFYNLTIKNTTDVEAENTYRFQGSNNFYGNFKMESTGAPELPKVVLGEDVNMNFAKSCSVSAGRIGYVDFNNPLTDHTKYPTLNFGGYPNQQNITINNLDLNQGIAEVKCNVAIYNENAKFISPHNTYMYNLFVGANFDLFGKTLFIYGKIVYDTDFNNDFRIRNTKPKAGKIVIYNTEEYVYDYTPQSIKIDRLRTLKVIPPGGMSMPNLDVALVNSLSVDTLQVNGFLNLAGRNLTIGKTTTSIGFLDVDSLGSTGALGTLTLLGNSATPAYVLSAKDLNNIIVNNPAGVELNNAYNISPLSDSYALMKLYGTLKLTKGDFDLKGSSIQLTADNLTSTTNVARIIETPGNTFISTVNPPSTVPYLYIEKNVTNAITNKNYGGLGFIISCSTPLNYLKILRQPLSETGLNGGISINRQYAIQNPGLITGLNANISIKYDDSELMGLNESDLHIFRRSSEDFPGVWQLIPSSVNTTTNTVTASNPLPQLNYGTYTYYTLATLTSPLRNQNELSNQSESNTTKMQVYPNPFQSTFTTQLVSETDESTTLKITDISGKLVHTQTVQITKGINTIKVDVNENLPSGIYILHITSLHTNKVVKIVKE
ncbi:MAG: T9SS type A sorting domain-containing protein [Bacteroidetes bacterium]|nr:T9SS type A sorting domain-containing protein [Bacteroidota bacterium]